MSNIYVKRVETDLEYEAALTIQQLVFVYEQGISEKLTLDPENANAIHVLAFAGDTPVATARLLPQGDGQAELARVAVTKNYRKSGIGRLLVKALEDAGLELGINRIELHPHIYLENFYADLGYQRLGGVHEVSGHELVTMEKLLKTH